MSSEVIIIKKINDNYNNNYNYNNNFMSRKQDTCVNPVLLCGPHNKTNSFKLYVFKIDSFKSKQKLHTIPQKSI